VKSKEEFLTRFNKKVIRILRDDSSFSNLYSLLSSNKLRLTTKYDYASTLIRLNEIKDVVNRIVSIVLKPHIKVTTSEVILRSELSSSISNESFIETIKDSKLWKNKDGEMTPEYVHTIENIDTIKTYENAFISTLINLISLEIDSLSISLTSQVDSLEEKYETKGINYSEFSLLNDFKEFGYPYLNVFVKKDSTMSEVLSLVNKIAKKIRILKNTEFYKINFSYSFNKNVMPTNILIHDNLYSFCYRFYKDNYLVKIKDDDSLDIAYYNYSLICLFNFLAKNEIAKTSLSSKAVLRVDKFNRIRFNKISFKRGLFSFFIKEDEGNNGIFIETRLIENAVQTNTSVSEDKISNHYIFFSYNLSDENFKNIREKRMNLNEINNFALITMNNFINEYFNVLNLSIYKNNHEMLFKNLISSLSMLFDCDTSLFYKKCPVCGKNEVSYSSSGYVCSDCKASYSLLNIDNKDLLWIKSFRRF